MEKKMENQIETVIIQEFEGLNLIYAKPHPGQKGT